jgi:hypothetical protein
MSSYCAICNVKTHDIKYCVSNKKIKWHYRNEKGINQLYSQYDKYQIVEDTIINVKIIIIEYLIIKTKESCMIQREVPKCKMTNL